ncbi:MULTISPECIES: GNAT family N-acetyltransferase [unclassified Arthrobacter]|uniref:GNAT family N-acetyltransferase n=1 Tax=unclassified Arthrobacter TaxID=235627 RepID=UPI00149179DF|nr:GNAT family N-acetyltransferase [Arthrobacter sp. AET 35A]NOJ61529.1 GNAT family N-acetyltransferase [Arthrobacter sp. 260]NOJ62068.1 GNAT family N-acetyltransferase [Arthrobacter sp. 147(2020)]
MTVTVRRATPDDAGALVELHNRTWREAYGHLGPPEFFDAREARAAADAADRRRELEDGIPWMVAVDEDDTLVGLALAGPSRDTDRDGTELYFLYALQRFYGRGVGPALLAETLGEQAASLWVLEVNHRATAFYVRNRFVADGARRKVRTEGSDLQEIRMVRH